MNKSDLVERVAKDTGLSKRATTRVINSVLEQIVRGMKKESVTLSGFGTFSVRKRNARTGRNLKTGKPIRIKSRKVPSFKPGKDLKERLG